MFEAFDSRADSLFHSGLYNDFPNVSFKALWKVIPGKHINDKREISFFKCFLQIIESSLLICKKTKSRSEYSLALPLTRDPREFYSSSSSCQDNL